jgi:hypothetical protein
MGALLSTGARRWTDGQLAGVVDRQGERFVPEPEGVDRGAVYANGLRGSAGSTSSSPTSSPSPVRFRRDQLPISRITEKFDPVVA